MPEWFSVFPILYGTHMVIPIPIPVCWNSHCRRIHCETYSHSRTIPENSFPLPAIPIQPKSLTNQNSSNQIYYVFF